MSYMDEPKLYKVDISSKQGQQQSKQHGIHTEIKIPRQVISSFFLSKYKKLHTLKSRILKQNCRKFPLLLGWAVSPNGPKLQIHFMDLSVDLSLYYLSRYSYKSTLGRWSLMIVLEKGKRFYCCSRASPNAMLFLYEEGMEFQ